MRTTVDLPDPIIRELKALAAQRGTSLKQRGTSLKQRGTSLKNVICSAVEVEIRRAQSKVVRRVNFPLLTSHEPSALKLKNADIDDLLA